MTRVNKQQTTHQKDAFDSHHERNSDSSLVEEDINSNYSFQRELPTKNLASSVQGDDKDSDSSFQGDLLARSKASSVVGDDKDSNSSFQGNLPSRNSTSFLDEDSLPDLEESNSSLSSSDLGEHSAKS